MTIVGLLKGDTRSSDYSSFGFVFKVTWRNLSGSASIPSNGGQRCSSISLCTMFVLYIYIYLYAYRYRYLDGPGVLDTSFVASCPYPTCVSAQRTSAPEFLFSGPDPGCGNVCLQTVLKDKNDWHPTCDEPAGYTLSPMNLTFQSCPDMSIATWLATHFAIGIMCPCITLYIQYYHSVAF